MSPLMDIAVHTAFVIHFTFLVFLAAVYGFAYKFIGDRFYVPFAVGWGINAVYIALEATLWLITRSNAKPIYAYDLWVSICGLAYILFFDLAVRGLHFGGIKSFRQYRPILTGGGAIAICGVGMLSHSHVSEETFKWFFAVITLPAMAYSVIVLWSVADKFQNIFPEDSYGNNARMLHVSWRIYAIFQLFYPLKYFSWFYDYFYFLFSMALLLKAANMIGLLNVMRSMYLTTREQVAHSSVLADLGNIAAGLHHDIVHPLMLIDTELDTLAQKRGHDDIVRQAIANVRKPLGMIQSAMKLVNLVRLDAEALAKDFKQTSVRNLVPSAISLFKKVHPNSSFRIVYDQDSAPPYYIQGIGDLIAEAFLNIIKNSYEAPARVMRIFIRRLVDQEGRIEFLFTNDGKPLSEDELMNCFKPGWSSKEAKEGRSNIGMGLYMASKIIKMHRGDIEIYNNENNENRFVAKSTVVVAVRLPVLRNVKNKHSSQEMEDE